MIGFHAVIARMAITGYAITMFVITDHYLGNH